MAIVDDVANYVRDQGRQSNGAVHNSQVANALRITMGQVETARSQAIRKFDDIYPCYPGSMVYEPDWKTKHPEEWELVQERSLQAQAMARKSPKPDRSKARARKKNDTPNVVGPVIMINNVQGVNVHPDHVSIQHTDGSWTYLDGSVMIEDAGNG